MLGLCCCVGFSLVVASRGYSLAAVHGLLTAVIFCQARALEHRFNSCGVWAKLLCSIWNRPRSGIEPLSPALTHGFFTSEPPGKS